MGEIASAHVTIYPKFANTFGSTVSQQVGASGKAAGTQMGKQIGAGLSAQAPKIGAGAGASIGAALKPMLTIAAAGTVARFVSDAVAGFGELEDATGAASVVFGSSMDKIIAQSETAATTMGMSKKQVIDAANTFGAYGKSAGLAGDELAVFSTDLTQLSADMASFRGTSPEEAIQAVGAALRGESEPIRRYGVLLDDATLRNRALRMGLIDTVKKGLTPQQRALAAQAEILAQTADAQGDFARTQENIANKTKIATAQAQNLRDAIGGQLAPSYERLIDSASGAMDWLSKHPEVLEAIGAAARVVTTGFEMAGTAAKTLFGPALATITGLLSGTVYGLGQLAGAISLFPGMDWAKTAAADLGVLSESLAATSASAVDLVTGASKAAPAVAAVGTSSTRATSPVVRATEALEQQTSALREAATAALKLSGSQIGLEAAIDDAAASVKENGKTLDISTAKGRANRQALDDIAASGLSVVDSLKATGASATKTDAAMGKTRRAFIEAAVSMGMSRTKARELADSLGLIKSKNVKVTVSLISPNVAAYMSRIQAAINKNPLRVPARLDTQVARASGGMVPALAAGGRVPGWSAHDKADNVPAMLTAGEWVHQVAAVKHYGPAFMDAINRMAIPKKALGLASGGPVAGAGGAGGGVSVDDLRAALSGLEVRLTGTRRFSDEWAGELSLSIARGV